MIEHEDLFNLNEELNKRFAPTEVQVDPLTFNALKELGVNISNETENAFTYNGYRKFILNNNCNSIQFVWYKELECPHCNKIIREPIHFIYYPLFFKIYGDFA